ncbi:MAG: alpha/beta hydrolase [Clostridia bacterium]|nr:alpha/beta hydrolase [Clostridia bacterium]
MEAVIQGCKLFYRYERCTKNDAPTVVFMHGWGCDGSIFRSFENAIGHNASMLLIDFPGHGQSGEPQEPWGVPEYAEQVRLLFDQLGLKNVHIIAHSFGGRVALWISSHYPELVNKMVITGGAGLRKPDEGKPTKRQQQYKRLKAVANAVGTIPFMKGIVAKWQEALVQKYGSADYKRLNPHMRKTFVKVINQDLTEYLPKIKASTLLIWGGNDTETPLWMGQQMEKAIPDAGLVVFDGRSHFAFLEEAQRFQVIVTTFLFGGNKA